MWRSFENNASIIIQINMPDFMVVIVGFILVQDGLAGFYMNVAMSQLGKYQVCIGFIYGVIVILYL